MKTLIASMAALAALTAAAAPAQAQPYDGWRGDRYEQRNDQWDRQDWDRQGWDRGGWDDRDGWNQAWNTIDGLGRRLEQDRRDGRIGRGAYQQLSNQLRSLAQLERRYMQGGLNGWERRDLEQRAEALEARMDAQRWDGRGRDRDRWR